MATWTAAGTQVTCCIATDGDAGGLDETPRDAMGPLVQATFLERLWNRIGASHVPSPGCADAGSSYLRGPSGPTRHDTEADVPGTLRT